MKVTETLNEGLKRGYTITIPASELEEKVNAKLAEAQPTVEMKGFRKGKVPMALLKKQFGKSILGEAMQETIDGAMTKHFDDSKDRPAARPDVKMTNQDWKEGDDVVVEMSYDRLPDIPDADLSKLKLERLQVEVEDDAVNEALENLAGSANNFEPRKKGSKAKEGDQVVINFLGKVDGVAFDGGQADDFPLVLGSNSFIPGFEDQLIGAKAGEDVVVNVKFPDEYSAPNLAGKDAVFECKINEVKEPKPAALDDELAKKFGAEDLKALKDQVKERLGEEFKGAARQVMKRSLMDQMDKIYSFELPNSLIDAEASQIAHQIWHEENPDVQGHDHPEIETTDEHKKLAERRVRLGLVIAELGEKNEIQVSDSEFQQAVMQQVQQYPGQEREFFEYIQKTPQMQQQLRAPIFEDKVIDYIVELAKVTNKSVTKDQLEEAIKEMETL